MDLNKSKSPGDEKVYRTVTLSSDLECLLISTKDKCDVRGEVNTVAAAAMAVQVGTFADPDVAGTLNMNYTHLIIFKALNAHYCLI